MRPVVTDTAWRLISEISLGRGQTADVIAKYGRVDFNPLRLGMDGDETPTRDVISDCLLDLGDRREAVAASLAGAYGRIDRYADGNRDIDAITASLIAHMGLEPLMVAWLAALCAGIHVRDEATREPLVDVDVAFKPHETRAQDTEVHLSDDVTWKACGTALVHGLPDAVAMAAEGRPLSSVVSHPALDALGLEVARVELADGDGPAELQTDFVHRYPTVEELARMEPVR